MVRVMTKNGTFERIVRSRIAFLFIVLLLSLSFACGKISLEDISGRYEGETYVVAEGKEVYIKFMSYNEENSNRHYRFRIIRNYNDVIKMESTDKNIRGKASIVLQARKGGYVLRVNIRDYEGHVISFKGRKVD